jgi:hypothetical protein
MGVNARIAPNLPYGNKNPARVPGRAQFFSFNFTNSLICADASSATRLNERVVATVPGGVRCHSTSSSREDARVQVSGRRLLTPVHETWELIQLSTENDNSTCTRRGS